MTDSFTARLGTARTFAAQVPARPLADLADVPLGAWRELFNRAAEPNAFYHPLWARAAAQHSAEAGHARALLAFDRHDRNRLIGLMPVVSAWQALGLPVPMLASWHPYSRLTTPLLDRECIDDAAEGLLEAARQAGVRALLLSDYSSRGPVAEAFRRALDTRALKPRMLRERERARLDATLDAETMLHEALGAKKLKELRRQHNRLSDDGPVTFDIASSPADVARALTHFLALEASGWKGARGTALAESAGDTIFIREAATALAAESRCEVITLAANGRPVASGIVLRHGSRAYFYKIAYDEAMAKTSPGVQLTLELTKRLCADGEIADADSTANAYHPMIDKIWRARLPIATALIPLRAADPMIGPFEFLINARERTRRDARKLFHALQDRLHALREKMR
jgi:CelD/BcsL family acetyltransferase involved in cellulose biosynthesis